MTDDSAFGDDDTEAGNTGSSGSSGSTSGSGTGGTSGTSSDTEASGSSSSGGSSAGVPATASSGPGVNSVIVDAVKQSNSTVLGSAQSNGAAIAYQKVAQAASLAVQDSNDYLRNVMAMSAAATGVILKKIAETPPKAPEYLPAIEAINTAVTDAQQVFAAVGKSAGEVVKGFPSS